MSDPQNAGDHPKIEDVYRAFCRAHCAAWVASKGKRGQVNDYCGKTITDHTRRCGWSRARIKERMR